jgi:hypothetical protein
MSSGKDVILHSEGPVHFDGIRGWSSDPKSEITNLQFDLTSALIEIPKLDCTFQIVD